MPNKLLVERHPEWFGKESRTMPLTKKEKRKSCFKLLDETYIKVLKRCEKQFKGKHKQVSACIAGTLYTTTELSSKKNQMSKCIITGYD